MSRIGNSPIQIPSTVTVTISDKEVKLVGPKGELTTVLMNQNVKVKQDDGILTVSRLNEEKAVKAYHGLFRSLLTI